MEVIHLPFGKIDLPVVIFKKKKKRQMRHFLVDSQHVKQINPVRGCLLFLMYLNINIWSFQVQKAFENSIIIN